MLFLAVKYCKSTDHFNVILLNNIYLGKVSYFVQHNKQNYSSLHVKNHEDTSSENWLKHILLLDRENLKPRLYKIVIHEIQAVSSRNTSTFNSERNTSQYQPTESCMDYAGEDSKIESSPVYHTGNSTEVKINDGQILKWYFGRMVQLLADHT